ncbi:hypothetical protein MRX96_000789 [Rhipicephalus microplus]
MHPNLSLATTLAKARLEEIVKQQQTELLNSNEVRDSTQFDRCEEVNVDTVGHRTKPCRSEDIQPPAVRYERQCIICSGHSHPRTDCLARAPKRFNCGLKGHFGKVRLKRTSPSNKRKARVSSVQKDTGESFLGIVEAPGAKARYVEVLVKAVPVFAKVDSGAEVSVTRASFPGRPTSL